MRVALLSHNAQSGDAIGNQVAEKLAFFLERGADARVFVESDRDLHPAVRPHCHVLPHPQPHGLAWQFLAGCDLVVAEYGQFYPLLNLLPLLAGGRPRVLIDYHGVTPPELWGLQNREALERGLRQRGLLWCADAVLAHSRYIRDELTGACGLPPERIRRLGFPIDLDQFRPGPGGSWRNHLGLEDASILLFVGRLAPNKRVPVLIEALARLRELAPPVHALVAGTTADVYRAEARRCLELAERLGVADRLHLLGHLTGAPLRDAYRSSDALVIPSLWESFCIPSVEAMACGIPVLAARTTALPETLGAAGLTFAPNDADDLARQLRRILAPKSETRNPKSETNPKSEGPKSETEHRPVSVIRNLRFGFVSDFGFRVSDFRPRVALVSFRYGADLAGGAEASLHTIAAALTGSGCAVEVFATRTRGESTWADELPEGTTHVDGVPVHRFRLDAHDRPRHLEAVRAVWQAGGRVVPEAEEEYLRHSVHSARLLEELKRRADEFDAVITGPYLYGLTHDVATALPGKTLLLPCFHDEPLAHFRAWQTAYTCVGGLLYHSPEEQDYAQSVLGLNHPGGTLLGTYLDTDARGDAESGRRAVSAPSGRYVVFAGRYSPQKELPVLLENARRYAERRPGRFTFAFMGEGPLPIPAEPWARDLGFLSESGKRDVLAGAAALLLPSRYESLSLAALEAWAQGTPVLANARCGVLVGQLGRSGGGRAVDGYEEFERALDELWETPEKWRELGERGRAYVRTHYGSRAAFTERLLGAIAGLRVPLAERLRQRGLERAAEFGRPAWREQFARVVEQVLDAGPRPYRARVEVRPRASERAAAPGARAVLVPVRVANRGTHPLVAEGPARAVLRCRVVDEQGRPAAEPSEGTPLPGLLRPGRALSAAVPVPVPAAPGVYRVTFWAERVDCGSRIADCRFDDGSSAAAPSPSDPQSATRNPQSENWLRLVVGAEGAADGCCGLALEAAQAALVEAERLRQLPDDYTDVTEGAFASLKRRIKRKLLGNFKRAYVDVLSRQQSACNAQLLSALRELAECCATLDHAVRVLLERVAELEGSQQGTSPRKRPQINAEEHR
jgi:glycosyltransferase involved in cell wall biosynthesis